MPITTTFIQVVSPSIQITTGTVAVGYLPGRMVVSSSSVVSATITNWVSSQIRDIIGLNTDGYGLGAYFSIPVNTGTRVTARTYNSLLTDLDIVLRHITSATIVSTVTQLSTWTNDLVVSTGTVVSATGWQSLINLTDFAQLNRYNIHPGQLASDPNGCTVSYDQSISYRTTSWGTGTQTVITMEVRAQWPTALLADSFFNTGGDFVFSPFLQSMTQTPQDITGTNLTLQTALNTDLVQVPLSISANGYGVGPIFHIDFSLWPYGDSRSPGSTDYFYTPGTSVSANAALLVQNPRIFGTVFQFVGVHYGDYTTQLVIGVRQGQTVPAGGTSLSITLNNDSTRQYTAVVPGYLDRYTGPNGGSLNGLNGWWIWEDLGEGYTPTDRQVSWFEIYTGRKGSDPIGLEQAVTSRQPFTIQIIPSELAAGSASPATGVGSTVTNAWAQFIDEIRAGAVQSYSYNRSHWRDAAWQTTNSLFTSSIGTNTNSISVMATRSSATVGQSNFVNFVVSATNFAVSDLISYYDPYTYSTSSQTCTNLVSLGNSTDGTVGNVGGDGGGFPWWVVAVGIVAEVAGVCFTGPTQIIMADGSRKAIRDVKPGDRVRNHRGTGENTVLFVEHKMRHNVPLVSPNSQHAPFITDNHPLIENQQWISADPDQHWHNYPWLGVAKPMKDPIIFHSPGERVYNLWVDGDHTYWVNDWATTSIIGDGSFLRLSVEQGHITEQQAIEILDSHTNGSRNLIVGSYYVNLWLGSVNLSWLNGTISQCLAGSETWAKTALKATMSAVGSVAGIYLWIKYKGLGFKPKI